MRSVMEQFNDALNGLRILEDNVDTMSKADTKTILRIVNSQISNVYEDIVYGEVLDQMAKQEEERLHGMAEHETAKNEWIETGGRTSEVY